MDITVLSSNSSYHHLSQLFTKEESNVYHYGANDSLKETKNYYPITFDLPCLGLIEDSTIIELVEKISSHNTDFVIASGIPLCKKQLFHDKLTDKKIPYFFVSPNLTLLEEVRSKTKKMLEKLDIPTPRSTLIDGKFLFENFKTLKRPFVVKLQFIFQYGRQTMIVDDHNYEEIYLDLFSIYLGEPPRIYNINFETVITLEEFIKLKREYSYHIVANKTGWKYLGSARDYKQKYEGDTGDNTLGMGAYNTDDINLCVHEYANKIVDFLKKRFNLNYKGFMFMNIGVDENNNHLVLEINTRSGNPELQVILSSIDNNLSELFYLLSTDQPIPDIQHNDLKSVTIKLMNTFSDWSKPAKLKPILNPPPSEILHSLDSGSESYVAHSAFTTSSKSLEESSKRIYNYLEGQNLGQFYCRKDIGILK